MLLVSSCSCLCPIHWSQALSWEWRCSWSNAYRHCSNYIWVINKFAYSGVPYIRGLKVHLESLYACIVMFSVGIPEYYLWRNSPKGSWFVQTLCKVMAQYGKTREIMSMLTNQFQSSASNPAMHEKQNPCIMNKLTRDLYFHPKKWGWRRTCATKGSLANVDPDVCRQMASLGLNELHACLHIKIFSFVHYS